jgi:hypothetical protein
MGIVIRKDLEIKLRIHFIDRAIEYRARGGN